MGIRRGRSCVRAGCPCHRLIAARLRARTWRAVCHFGEHFFAALGGFVAAILAAGIISMVFGLPFLPALAAMGTGGTSVPSRRRQGRAAGAADQPSR
ncbi:MULTISPECIES: hypothetical protein [Streptomyces]|uniref:Uncharacterized protein n=1 Tax=Streptomyces rimosus subsp. rimosus (strain ATCC 10970 / DSM 40260 / JCM 4667 / NRRL 2234) TaxID=1265868 RepID=A0A8A1V4Q4_STRR1|nr:MULTISPECIES: hypothetical protein [Streptomyces]MYT47907.1 hypothetical protein [Streptomyces sp. SID5471]QGY69132.1 hypothetical protein V519_027485 [Streptomyces rimosus R6-500]QST85545.1 hypothetical protein SRIM_040395 [Streptomyces rimosus subsp. rimosus ATCC 10970]QTL84672.1 hypothetical protein FMM49_01595 [Streptomyces rimosus subsp. rimosus]